MTCLAAKHLNFERALDNGQEQCRRLSHCKELTETGNRARKVSGIQIRKQLEASDLICVRIAKGKETSKKFSLKLSTIILKSKCAVSEREIFLEMEKKNILHIHIC